MLQGIRVFIQASSEYVIETVAINETGGFAPTAKNRANQYQLAVTIKPVLAKVFGNNASLTAVKMSTRDRLTIRITGTAF